jgi:hypothetical protein
MWRKAPGLNCQMRTIQAHARVAYHNRLRIVMRQLGLEFFRFTERLLSGNQGMPSLTRRLLRLQLLFYRHEDPLE